MECCPSVVARAARHDQHIWAYLRDVPERLVSGGVELASLLHDAWAKGHPEAEPIAGEMLLSRSTRPTRLFRWWAQSPCGQETCRLFEKNDSKLPHYQESVCSELPALLCCGCCSPAVPDGLQEGFSSMGRNRYALSLVALTAAAALGHVRHRSGANLRP